MRTKNTKSTLIIGICVLLLCITMLIVSTFAWFTDTVSNTGNRIQAGILDVDLLMYKEDQGSNPVTYSYQSIAGGSGDIFDEADNANNSNITLWEPGKTQWVYLAIKNNGSLALKYTVSLDVKDVNGYDSMVQNNESALEYAIVPGVKQSDESETLLKSKTWDEIKAYALAQADNETTNAGDVTIGTFTAAGTGVMDEIANGTTDETQYFLLAVHMKEDAVNKFQNAAAVIDITVNATQYTAEEDAFGNDQYDKNASIDDEEDNNPYLTFSSATGFKLGILEKGWGDTETSYLETSTDGNTWTKWDGSDVIAVQNGDKYYVYLRGTGLTTLSVVSWDEEEKCYYSSYVTNLKFTSIEQNDNLSVDCSGNIMTLLDYNNKDTVVMGKYAFANLFDECTALASAPTLPATDLAEGCYEGMFACCTSLTTAPALPATNLASDCYYGMFASCTSLTTAPALPATNLAECCYCEMFAGCTSLISAPALPATNLAECCYCGMFAECESLETAPALSATNLAISCYEGMFDSCISLTTASALPATNLANSCYAGMFHGCTSLTSAPALPATTLAEKCYFEMFYECTSLTTVPALSATTLALGCYQRMFGSCTSLYVSDTETENATYAWTIPEIGTFANTDTFNQAAMFANCLGTRSSNDMSGATGETHTYYTQNAPVK